MLSESGVGEIGTYLPATLHAKWQQCEKVSNSNFPNNKKVDVNVNHISNNDQLQKMSKGITVSGKKCNSYKGGGYSKCYELFIGHSS